MLLHAAMPSPIHPSPQVLLQLCALPITRHAGSMRCALSPPRPAPRPLHCSAITRHKHTHIGSEQAPAPWHLPSLYCGTHKRTTTLTHARPRTPI